MAAVAQAAEQAKDLLQNLSLESKNKAHDAPEIAKKASAIQYVPANGVEAKLQIPSSERSLTPVLPEFMDHNLCYLSNGYPSTAFYYGGYDGSMGNWEEYSRYVNPEGVEVPHGVYGDMHHHGYGYASFGAYHSSGYPAVPLGHESQTYGAQLYQYPSPYFRPQAVPSGAYPSKKCFSGEVASSPSADQAPAALVSAKSNANGIINGVGDGNNVSVSNKQSNDNPPITSNGLYGGVVLGGHQSPGYQDPRFTFDGVRSPIPWFEGQTFSDVYARHGLPNFVPSSVSHITNSVPLRNQNVCSVPQHMALHAPRPTAGMNRLYPNNHLYGKCGNAYRTGFSYGPNAYDSRINSQWGLYMDGKYRPRGCGNGYYGYANENLDELSELIRGPRANRFRTIKGPLPTIAAKEEGVPTNENAEDAIVVPDREKYNGSDISENYSEAKFFIIKSYSEDDIHKSIKYNVWASTPNGNKKLDAAYKDAKDKAVECPVFFMFSVNTSGQFVGVAEMVGPVDFNKTVDYWQQDKWNGCFSVRWHIVKDVPNSILKHITVESNENKPVTNSRDTQEVKLEQGLQMLKVFKEHVRKTSILDDFVFYETREKAMKEKRAKQLEFSRLIANVKPAGPVLVRGKDGLGGNPRLQKPLESVTVLKREVASVGLGELKPSDDGCLPNGDVSKVVANACLSPASLQ
ncbi:hypothetical protein HPP92_018055 [Vanilla planifolia]|uniref:YTH domain-containing family protein n=1 Tax=Vanilla planifolia TaxID=51239 RepID=A0A835UP12_VANPL|nr:hypothetical protein HPP92_018055 [Vanilla planifolia]